MGTYEKWQVVTFHWQDGRTMHLMAIDLCQTLIVGKVPALYFHPSPASPLDHHAKTYPLPAAAGAWPEKEVDSSMKPSESSPRCDWQQGELFQGSQYGRTWLVPSQAIKEGTSSRSWIPLPKSGRWTSRGEFSTPNISECPNEGVESSLSSILEENVPPRYYLSPEACRGIIQRALAKGRALPQHLRNALEAASMAATNTSPATKPSQSNQL